jgi:NAD(P)-dependent dehydrogenase (short-subunit alcohol dehydrogenase family)
MTRFEDRVAIVTGAARGLGRGIATAFADEGAHVVLADVDGERLERTADDLRAGGRSSVVSRRCDVSSSADVEALVTDVLATLGRIDHLVNNAGTITIAPFVEVSEEDWTRVLAVNLTGVFLCTRAVLPHMLARKRGSIVNIASQAGKRPNRYISHYCVSKAGVISLTQNVALEAAPHVRVNCVCPGIINTELQEEEYAVVGALTGKTRAEIQAEWLAAMPGGRFQEVEDVAGAVLYLASDAAAHVTGEALNVSGGMVMD